MSQQMLDLTAKAAVLFDFDGVLVNSFDYHIAAWHHALAPHRIPFDPMIVYLNEGRPVREIAAEILNAADRKLSASEISAIVDEKNRVFQQTNQASLLPGVAALLGFIKHAGKKTALVTGTIRQNVDNVLGRNLHEQFDAIVTETDSPRGKPHPDPYLTAAGKLAVVPAACLVIENAPMGIAAAKAAGMICVAVATTLPEAHLGEADLILPDMAALLQALKTANA